jgi:hypothetical protein
MGTFGLGGLHRKSTWLYPVATFASLPPTAVDGSVAITLDNHQAYEYDASIPAWIPLTSGGGMGPQGPMGPPGLDGNDGEEGPIGPPGQSEPCNTTARAFSFFNG